MSTFVLVHGAWGGAWIWRRVVGALRAAGHEVHAVTLTGDGERAHLRRPDISLRTHLDDVLGLIDAEELHDIVLVGHSYGGMVITGAADALLARGSARLRHLVYVDAMVPVPGEGWGSGHPPEIVAARMARAAANDNALPPPDPRDFGIEGVDREWLLREHAYLGSVYQEGTRVRGFSLPLFGHGLIVADSPEVGLELQRWLLPIQPYLRLPVGHLAAHGHLMARKYTATRAGIRMVRGDRPAFRPTMIYAHP